ncbi:LAMI_0H19592g1_1 [Lachancea mirantina]|uniref:LAMI_0H19592g1_1 n=1 Tax=Lachancea mirantina TaxID=1230905 RepID=A0A1G4KK18_9SACH|nr:LAMI_0H19592g1_1 [Lachancea mirantina]
MDYQERAGSKKGSGGIASASQENLHRRRQVDELLGGDAEVPFSFGEEEVDDATRKNPYIYKNSAGRLVCKLCNTMHMSWSSVQRHINGKKHGLNVLRRGATNNGKQRQHVSEEEAKMKDLVKELRSEISNNGILPKYKAVLVKDGQTGREGFAMQVDYPNDETTKNHDSRPFVRLLSGIELPDEFSDELNYLVVANEPFENIGVELPKRELQIDQNTSTSETFVDGLNENCTYWNKERRQFYVQIFFQ